MDSIVTGQRQYSQSLGNSVHLFRHIGQFGEALAVIDEAGESWTYSAFTVFADAACSSLPRRKCLVGIEVSNDLRSLAAYVGALRAGHAVMLLKDGTSSQDQAFLARFVPDFLSAKTTNGWAPGASGTAPVMFHPDLAVLLTTSGSSGDPKLVRLSHENLSSNAAAIAAYLEFAPGERAITTLPFHYSYGMSVVNSHLSAGGAIILNDTSIHEPAFWDRFRTFGATSFAGVPHTFSLLERSGFTSQPPPPSLRYYTQAGGKLPGEAVVLFSRYAEEHDRRFYVMYGQTEASPRIAYVPPGLIGQHPDVIGIPIPGGTITLLDEAGLPIEADGVVGELVYTGPNVMMGYGLCQEDLSRGPEHQELRTGDLAMRGAEGLYTIKGRRSRFVKIFGLRIGLDNIELQLRMAGFEAVATGSDDHLQIGVIGSGVSANVTRCILHHHHLTASSIEVLEVTEMPRLASGKVDYAGLRKMFEARADPASSAAGALSLREAFAELLGRPSMTPEDSFSTAGGDSLTFINASLLLEDRLGFAPEGWERIPIRDLEQIPSRIAPGASPARSSSRMHFLDEARMALMLLGIPYHAAMAYSVNDWIVKTGETSLFLTAFAEFTHTFRMPAFFLLAGFFAMLIVDDKEPMQWWKKRVFHIGIPLACSILLINPVIMLGRSLAAGSELGVLADWTSQLAQPGQHWIEHAWFLLFLIVYSFGLALLCGIVPKQRIAARVASFAELVLNSPLALAATSVAAGIAVVFAVGVLRFFGVNFILWDMVSLSSLAALLPAFMLGCMLASRRERMLAFSTMGWSTVLLAMAGAVALALVQQREEPAFRVATFFLIPATGIYWAKIVLALASKFSGTPRPWVRELVDGSMTIYLIHQVFIVFLVVLFLRVDLGPLAEFILVSLASVLLSVGFYRLTLRSPLLTLLFSGSARHASPVQGQGTKG